MTRTLSSSSTLQIAALVFFRCTLLVLALLAGALPVPLCAVAEERVLRDKSDVEFAVVDAERRVPGEASESGGSALYSPFSAGASVKHVRPAAASNPPRDRDSGLGMTVAATMACVGALAWLLRRI
ncbi:hypothetical protein [Variovorax sp. GT1P44]|uniref:hypothetical protein n=1 Tax=Variovorax sp. GT1P44 TaxID=3443742 RepID=UPI003F471008